MTAYDTMLYNSFWNWLTPAGSPNCFDQAKEAHGDMKAIGKLSRGGGKIKDREMLACKAVKIWVIMENIYCTCEYIRASYYLIPGYLLQRDSVDKGEPAGSHSQICLCLFRNDDMMPMQCAKLNGRVISKMKKRRVAKCIKQVM